MKLILTQHAGGESTTIHDIECDGEERTVVDLRFQPMTVRLIPDHEEQNRPFTEADVKRYAQFIAGHPDAAITPRHLAAARAVLDGLTSDGRLLPAGESR